MPDPCDSRSGPLFCHNGGPVPVDPYPTTDGEYIAAVVIQDGEPTRIKWLNAGGGGGETPAAPAVMQTKPAPKKKPPRKKRPPSK